MSAKRNSTSPPPQEFLFPREKEHAVLAGDDSTLDCVRQALRHALRAPRGVFRHRWSAARMPNGREGHDANQMLPLVCAWSVEDMSVARDLLLGAFSLQQADEGLPRMIDAGGRALSTAAAWPLLARATLRLWEADPDPSFLRPLLPRIERHLLWARSYFDAEPGAAPAWHGPEESFLGPAWTGGAGTVDLAAMLLSEIDAFLKMVSTVTAETPHLMDIQDWRRDLGERMESLFYDATTGLYADRRPTGEWADRRTMSSFLPLLWPGMPPERRPAMMSALVAEDGVLIERGAALWERRPQDGGDPPCPVLQQAVLLDAIDPATDGPAYIRLSEVLKTHLYPRLVAGRIHDRTSAEPAAGADDPAIEAALALRLWMGRGAAFAAPRIRPWARWLGQHTGVTVGALAGLLLLAMLTALVITASRPGLPAPSLEALGNLGRSHYEAGRYDEAVRLLGQVVWRNDDASLSAQILLGNAFFKKGDYRHAEEAYRRAVRAPDHVATLAQFNLAQSLYRQNRTAEAIQALEAFLGAYERDYPEYVTRARLAIDLMKLNPAGGAALIEDDVRLSPRPPP